jgi:hypothetical protein
MTMLAVDLPRSVLCVDAVWGKARLNGSDWNEEYISRNQVYNLRVT